MPTASGSHTTDGKPSKPALYQRLTQNRHPRKVSFADTDQVAEFTPNIDEPPPDLQQQQQYQAPPPGWYQPPNMFTADANVNSSNPATYNYAAAYGYGMPPQYAYYPYAYPPVATMSPQQEYNTQGQQLQQQPLPPPYSQPMPPQTAAVLPSNEPPIAPPTANLNQPLIDATNQPTVPIQQSHQIQDTQRMQLLAKSVSITVNPSSHLASVQSGNNGAFISLASSSSSDNALPLTNNLNNSNSTSTVDNASSIPLPSEEELEAAAVMAAQRRLMFRLLQLGFGAWKRVWEHRKWKVQIAMRDMHLENLASTVRHLENRPVRYMNRRKTRYLLLHWLIYSRRKEAQRVLWDRTVARHNRALMKKGLRAFQAIYSSHHATTPLKLKAERIDKRRSIQRAFKAWQEGIRYQQSKQMMLKAAEDFRARHLMLSCVGRWWHMARFYATERQSVQKYNLKLAQTVFLCWKEHLQVKKARRALVEKSRQKHLTLLKGWAFDAWQGYLEGTKLRDILEEYERLKAEHDRVTQENERLCHIIDSGEWDRQRVTELSQAGQILQQERDALLRLVETLPGGIARSRRGSRITTTVAAGGMVGSRSATTSRKGSLVDTQQPILIPSSLSTTQQQQQSTAALEAATLLSATQAHRPSPLPSTKPTETSSRYRFNADAQNKMFVKNGSSFNALVRALKQDLIASGAMERDPNIAFDIDKLSVNRLQLKTDGSVIVEGAANGVLSTSGQTFPKAGLVAKANSSTKLIEEEEEGLKQSELLQAAQKLQGLNRSASGGGRSVAFGKRVYDSTT